VATWFRWQAGFCGSLGSPLYEHLMNQAADDIDRGGPVWAAVAGMEVDPPESAPALRFMGAVHRIVLERRAPDLAARYPSTGGQLDIQATWPVFLATVEAHLDELRETTRIPVQTNEVGRAGALVGGFLTVAEEVDLPLRILECGASAGLLLNWDRYRYEARGGTWGPEDSPVRLCDYNSESPLPFSVEAEVVERSGCDLEPVDARTEAGRTTLLAFVWPDQISRIRHLRGALEVAAAAPPPVAQASAPDWLARQFEVPSVATVAYHSIFFQYLSPDERTQLTNVIEEMGARATDDAPFAWLRFEPGGAVAETRLTLWPGNEERLVATSGYHGTAVRWLL
jgi:hypothetical protein